MEKVEGENSILVVAIPSIFRDLSLFQKDHGLGEVEVVDQYVHEGEIGRAHV